MRGQAVTGGSTPKATLFERVLFRKLVARCLSTESYGDGVASGLTETEKDSSSVVCSPTVPAGHHGPHDAHHVAGESSTDIQEAILFLPRVELGPDTVKEIDVRRFARVLDWEVQREDLIDSRFG